MDCCSCDGEPIGLDDTREGIHVAKKTILSRRCTTCDEIIQAGEIYATESYRERGKWHRVTFCECCEAGWEILQSHGVCRLFADTRLPELWDALWSNPQSRESE